ncbi:MAG: hypothetical protein WCE21_02870 [Candidatus Babeliales bacterium]
MKRIRVLWWVIMTYTIDMLPGHYAVSVTNNASVPVDMKLEVQKDGAPLTLQFVSGTKSGGSAQLAGDIDAGNSAAVFSIAYQGGNWQIIRNNIPAGAVPTQITLAQQKNLRTFSAN